MPTPVVAGSLYGRRWSAPTISRSPTLTDLTATGAEADAELVVVDLAGDRADEVLSSIASSTAREILEALGAAPTYPAALADRTGTSVQNVHYHLSKLEDAGVVEVVDTAVSEKGREMDVYAPTADPLVLLAGVEGEREAVVEALSRLLGAVGLLAVASVLVQLGVDRILHPGGPTRVGGGAGTAGSVPVTNVAPPAGLAVFAVGLLVLAGWAVRRR